ncbi:arylesterase [Paenochrobactrum sp. BZR 588]|uniref:arylesterase n=1 Tax=Paenochrobactrum TaxID=999488 RepID=UPI0035BBAFCE
MRFKPLAAFLHIILIIAIMGLFALAARAQGTVQNPEPDMEESSGLEEVLPEDQLSSFKIIGFGDSLMAGYLLPAGDAFPQQLEDALLKNGFDVSVENAGVSGDTTTGGLERLNWSVPDDADLVILELGANDALRGIAPEITAQNLDQMLERLQARKIPAVLAGMIAPPNMGADYAAQFNPIYQKLADKYQVPLYPFFLEGVMTNQSLQLEDGMHPNAEGVAVMVANFSPFIQKTITELQNQGKAQ